MACSLVEVGYKQRDLNMNFDDWNPSALPQSYFSMLYNVLTDLQAINVPGVSEWSLHRYMYDVCTY